MADHPARSAEKMRIFIDPTRVSALIQNIVDHDNEHAHIPDYGVRMDEDMVTFTNRGTMLEDQQSAGVPSFRVRAP
jgi:hypothetical protein